MMIDEDPLNAPPSSGTGDPPPPDEGELDSLIDPGDPPPPDEGGDPPPPDIKPK